MINLQIFGLTSCQGAPECTIDNRMYDYVKPRSCLRAFPVDSQAVWEVFFFSELTYGIVQVIYLLPLFPTFSLPLFICFCLRCGSHILNCLICRRHRSCCCTCSGRDNGAGVKSSDVWTEGMIKSRGKKQPQQKTVRSRDTIYGKQHSSVVFLLSPRTSGLCAALQERKSLPDNEVILVKAISWKLVLQDAFFWLEGGFFLCLQHLRW